MLEPVIVVHGGAGDIKDSVVPSAIEKVKKAAEKGYKELIKSGNALDAVQAAVEFMEDEAQFNAGKGGALTLEGDLEMDAIIMEGTKLELGSVGCVRKIAHPVALARIVMEKSPHTMLVGEGAEKFAEREGIKTIPAYKLITKAAIDNLEDFLEGVQSTEENEVFGKGTVGAVALDQTGKVAVATSTGGTTGKFPGRIGDTPLPGSGGYADNRVGAVSTTGKGESIMRVCLSSRILFLMEQGKKAQQATEDALQGMKNRVDGTAGAIVISNHGEIGISFTSKRMAWAFKKGNRPPVGGVDLPQSSQL